MDATQLIVFLSNLSFRGHREIILITFLAKLLLNCKSKSHLNKEVFFLDLNCSRQVHYKKKANVQKNFSFKIIKKRFLRLEFNFKYIHSKLAKNMLITSNIFKKIYNFSLKVFECQRYFCS